ncbi:hypothetical protein CBR_g26091 [Chara braunii]|uniref:Uncharacterized protein n=1 Tax=Chara braunii TaxID=69332 RepID=A0A388JVX4_CHABU|nr:hypothetical protein CBR_g26091 [Chara braunii]|eukprot:GBG61928.1 hypothetical protein CBR_g26091 [Chara braunii]
MEDVLQRVPLLLLATLLLLLVVLLHVCVVVWGPGSRRKRRAVGKTAMDRRETSSGQQARAIDFSTPELVGRASRTAAFDLMLYSHLPPHEQPLPPDQEEEWVEDLSHMLPLGSGSTQDWMGSHCRQGEVETIRQSFSSVLEEGIGGGNMEIVDLDFGLSSGTAAAVTHTHTFNLVAGVSADKRQCIGWKGWRLVEGLVHRVAAQMGVVRCLPFLEAQDHLVTWR